MFRHRWLAFSLAMVVLLVPACSDDDDPVPTVQGNTYSGLLAAPSEHGTFEVMVADTTSSLLGSGVPVTGTLTIVGGSTIALSGTYDSMSGIITVAGGGYTLVLTVSGNDLEGSYTGPSTSGVCDGVKVEEGATVESYCGSFSGDDSGFWDFLVLDGITVFGTAYSTVEDEASSFSGTLSGGMISVNTEFGTTAVGTVGAVSASGTWMNASEGINGSWSGSSDCGGTLN